MGLLNHFLVYMEGLRLVLPLAVQLNFCWTSRGDPSKIFLPFEFLAAKAQLKTCTSLLSGHPSQN